MTQHSNKARLYDLRLTLSELVRLPAGHFIVGAITSQHRPDILQIRVAGAMCPEMNPGCEVFSTNPVRTPDGELKFPIELDRPFFRFKDEYGRVEEPAKVEEIPEIGTKSDPWIPLRSLQPSYLIT